MASTEFQITYGSQTYTVPLGTTAGAFYVKSSTTNAAIQVPMDTLEHLYAAAQAVQMMRNIYGTNGFSSLESSWQAVESSAAGILGRVAALNAIGRGGALVIASGADPASIVSNAPGALLSVIDDMKPAAQELAITNALMLSGTFILNLASQQYQSLFAPGNSGPVSYCQIKATANDMLQGLAFGKTASDAAFAIDSVNQSWWDDVIGFGKAFMDTLSGAVTSAEGIFAPLANVAGIDLAATSKDVADQIDGLVSAQDEKSYLYTLLNNILAHSSDPGLTDQALQSDAASLQGSASLLSGTTSTTYSISPTNAHVDEDKGSLVFAVTRSNFAQSGTVYVSTVADLGTSNPNRNTYYVGIDSRALVFAAGSATASVTVSINDLHLTSGGETFRLIVQQNGTDAPTTSLASTDFTIVNNDPVPVTHFSFSPVAPTINENAGSRIFTLTRDRSDIAQTVYVSTVHDQTAINTSIPNYYYQGILNQPVTFAIGQTSEPVTLTVNDLHLTSGSETFRLIAQQSLADPVTVSLASTLFTIANTDTPTSNPPASSGPLINEQGARPIVTLGSSAVLNQQFFSASESGVAASALTYHIVTAPSYGSILKGGSAVTTFTQADVNAGIVTYKQNGSPVSADSLVYDVIDASGHATPNVSLGIDIQPNPNTAATTHPTLTANAPLMVGIGQSEVLTPDNLLVTDSGVAGWNIFYTVKSAPTHGSLVYTGGTTALTSFTQSQLNLGLVEYVNNGSAATSDGFTFSVSDAGGGTIGATNFGVTVIPKNNLSVNVTGPMYTNPGGSVTPSGKLPMGTAWTPINASILSASDPGVDPANIVYTIQAWPANAAGILIGQWASSSSPGYLPDHPLSDFAPGDPSPDHFTQAQVNAGQVFYRQWNQIGSGENWGDQFSLSLSVADNVGNAVSGIVIPVTLEPWGFLSNGVFTKINQSPTVAVTDQMGGTLTVGRNAVRAVFPQFADSQIAYSLWYTPQSGTVYVGGQALAAGTMLTQQDIDNGLLAYVQNGAAAASDTFGLKLYNPSQPGSVITTFAVNVALIGTNGGSVFTPAAGTIVASGLGNNWILGSGTVSYGSAPTAVTVDLGLGTASNGYGGTDTLANVTGVIGSAYNDKFVVGTASVDLVGNGGTDVALFSGKRSAYTISRTSTGLKVVGTGQTDTLEGIATLQFSDITVAATSATYRLASAKVNTAVPISLGNHHVGEAVSRTLSITNSAAADGLSENLDATVAGTTGLTASGAFTGLAAGKTDTTDLKVGLDTTSAGAKSGAATLTLTSDGTGVDSYNTTPIGTQSVAVTGTVYAYAAPVLTAATLNLGAVRLGGSLAAGTIKLSDGTIASSWQESLIYSATGASGLTVTGGSGTIASGGTAALGFSLSSATAGTITGTGTLALTSTGTGTSGLANSALAAQTVTVNGKVYAAAKAALSATSINFGHVHVGAAATQSVGITNTATGALTDLLTGGTATNTGSVSGEVFTLGTGLAAGAAGTVQISANTAATGTVAGSAVLGFTSHDADLADLAVNAGTVSVSGGVYAYAGPSLSAATLNLGAVRLGGSLAGGTIKLSDGTIASAWQESLIYSATGASGLTVTGGSGTIASGGTAALGFSLSAATAGNFTGTQASLALTSTGVGTSGLANTALTAQTVTVNGKVYAAAKATLGATSINAGIVHVGASVSETVGVTNTAAGALTDLLTGGTATIGGVVSGVTFNLGTGIASGAGGTAQIAINTDTAGTFSGSAVLGFTSHDGDLADLAVNGGTVTVTGTVDNYATAQIVQSGGSGTLTHSGTAYVLNLGSVVQNGTALVADLGVLNAASGPVDLLDGSFAAGATTSFSNSGLTAFFGLGAGASETSQVVTLNTGTVGVFSETITLYGTGSNGSGYSGTLAAETLTVTGTVLAGQSFTLTAAPQTIVGTTGNDKFYASSTILNSHDSIDGNAGVDTLVLTGSGAFDLGAPALLTNIEVVTTQESAAGTMVYMRNGLNVTVNVGAAGSGSLLIYGGSDSDVYNLGAGSDTVVLGSATESVYSGGGTAVVQATAALATAAVVGGATGTTTLSITSAGTVALNAADANLIVQLGTTADTVVLSSTTESVANTAGGPALVQATAALASDKVIGTSGSIAATTLEITTGGSVTLNAADTNLTVILDAKTNLTLGSLGFIKAVGSSTGGETITAGGANQTLQTIGGNETLVGSASFGDIFLGKAAGFVGDLIKNFGTGDSVDLTDIAFGSLKPLSFSGTTNTTVAVSDATHSASVTFVGSFATAKFSAVTDGAGGTLIKWG